MVERLKDLFLDVDKIGKVEVFNKIHFNVDPILSSWTTNIWFSTSYLKHLILEFPSVETSGYRIRKIFTENW